MEQYTEVALWDGMQAGLVAQHEELFRFVYDRVQEAAYSQSAPIARAEPHLSIGWILQSRPDPEARREHQFEAANQLDQGACLLRTASERWKVERISRVAGERAKSMGAHAAARQYFDAGLDLIRPAEAVEQAALVFSVRLGRAECDLVGGSLDEAELQLKRPLTKAGHAADGDELVYGAQLSI